MSQATPAYDALTERHARLHRLAHLQSLAHWDQAAFMPPGGNDARTAALTELAGLLHRQRTDAAIGPLLAQAAQEPLGDWARANLREMQRDWQLATALPEALVERRSQVVSRCGQAWRQQRPANDWAGFLENFRPVLAVAREEARLLAERSGLSPYDALLDQYEPGMTRAEVKRVFDEVRQWLPGLIQAAVARQAAQPPLIEARGPFPVEAQRRLSEQVMHLLGFDFNAGRLDVSAHPFTGGVPEDVRMTTRFNEADFLSALMGTVHETGHGRYEQNLPRELLGQPIARARSMGIHESQSLSFEMQLGSHPAFAGLLAPLLVKHFGAQPAFAPDNLHKLLTRVQPGLIRVDADEVTYPAHVMLRFDIERALIEGEAEVDDIPALWDAQMAELLGLDTRGNFKDGPMQDVHWPAGLFGYFPCYTLGAMYAAQWFASMRRLHPTLDEQIARGELAPVFDWLDTRVWQAASRFETPELVLRASGEALNPAHFQAHLRQRYLG